LIGWRRLPIVADLVKQLRAVVIPDQLAQVIEQLDDGESLFRRLIGRNGEGHCQDLAGRGRFHDVAPWYAHAAQPWWPRGDELEGVIACCSWAA
jgi:hypothetical protein